MANMTTTYSSFGDTTEWDDLQRKFGNFAPLPVVTPQRVLDQLVVDAVEELDPLAHATVGELHGLEDDVDDDILARYRKQRLTELKAKQRAAKFGDVRQVTKGNFVKEVTDASADGQWVVVLMYVDASPSCHQMFRPWTEAAKRFPAVKFLRGVATDVVDDFPDASTPAILVYRDLDCKNQLIGVDEWGGMHCDADCIEWRLSKLGVVDTDLEDDPRLLKEESRTTTWDRPVKSDRRQNDSDSEEQEDVRDDRCYTSSKLGRNMLQGR